MFTYDCKIMPTPIRNATKYIDKIQKLFILFEI